MGHILDGVNPPNQSLLELFAPGSEVVNTFFLTIHLSTMYQGSGALVTACMGWFSVCARNGRVVVDAMPL